MSWKINRPLVLWGITVSILLVVGCATGSSPNLLTMDMIPSGDGISGWMKDGEAVQCNSLGELSRQINGGAPFYVDRGAQSAIFQDYQKAGQSAYINLVIYQMENHEQATNLMKDVFMDDPFPLFDIGSQCRLAPKLIGVYSVDLVENNMYARATISEKNDESREALIGFARIVSSKL